MSDHFPTTRNEFLASFLRQYFSLPDSMIYYITKNPSSSKVYQKLIQTCKYFFIKNPILVFHCLQIRDDGWGICSNHTSDTSPKFYERIATPNLSNCKLWIENKIRIYSTISDAAADLAPKIYQCDAEMLTFGDQKISFQQFLFFYAKNLRHVKLDRVIFTSDSGVEVPLEGIIAMLSKIATFLCTVGTDSKNISYNTAKKLLQIPHFKNIEEFRLFRIPQKFDIDPLYDYYKKNRSQLTFVVLYRTPLSEAFKVKLGGLFDEILNYKSHERMPPFIIYAGQDATKQIAWQKLRKPFI